MYWTSSLPGFGKTSQLRDYQSGDSLFLLSLDVSRNDMSRIEEPSEVERVVEDLIRPHINEDKGGIGPYLVSD